jgi:threonine/homoserine/homoserine lactone efflux protein
LPIASEAFSEKAEICAGQPMSFNAYLSFATAIALLLVLPGPTNALLMAAGTERRLARAMPLIGAEIVAYGLAIAPLLLFNEFLGAWRLMGGLAMKSVAIGVILLLAYRLWRHTAKASTDGAMISGKSVFWITLFNPKSLIFAFVIFPPVSGAADALAKTALFVVLAMSAGALWIAAGTLLASGGLKGSRLIGRFSAIVLVAFAVYLGTSVVTGAASFLR